MLTIQAVDHIVLNVADVEVSAAWYEQILGMTRVDQRSASGDIRMGMMFGANKINLRPVDVSQESWFTARSPTVGGEDLCFLTTAEPDAVARHFRAHGIEVVAGPIRKSGARGSVQSVYVRDSDGTSLKCRPTANRSPHSAVGREGGSRGDDPRRRSSPASIVDKGNQHTAHSACSVQYGHVR